MKETLSQREKYSFQWNEVLWESNSHHKESVKIKIQWGDNS